MPYLWGDAGYGEGPYGGELDEPSVDLSPSVAPIDHVALGLSRVIKQYQESAKLLAFIRAILSPFNEQEAALQQLFYLLDIDQMLGVNLDVIGSIVGQTRYLDDTVQLTFFGFADDPAAATFGEETNVSIGSRFYEEGEPYLATSVLGDAEYRLLIRARIVKNNSVATDEAVLAALSYLFQTQVVNIDDFGGMSFGVAIGRPLTQIERIIVRKLKLLPKPMGVTLSAVVSYNTAAYFGFFGQPNALTFSEETAPNGALLAEEV